MSSYGNTRHTARLALVRSAALEDADFGSAPNNPYAYATRWSRWGPDYWEALLDGKNRKEIMSIVVGFAIVVVTSFVLDVITIVYMQYSTDLALSGSFVEFMFVSALFWPGFTAVVVVLYYTVVRPFLR